MVGYGKLKIGAIVAVFAMLSACVPPRTSALKNGKVIIDGSTGTEVSLSFDTQPANGVAGSTLGQQPKVSLRDSLGSIVAGSTMRITLSLYSDSNCTTLANTTPNGSAAFTGTIAKDASFGSATFQTVAVHRASTSLYMKAYAERVTTACSSVFSTTPGPVAASQSVIGGATQVTSSAWTTISITAKDAYGNLAPTGISSVTFNSVTAGGTGSFGSVTNAGSGVYNSNFTGQVAGLVTLSGTINGTAIGGTHSILVIHGAATHLVLTSIPASTTAGVAVPFTVTAKDAWENTCTAYTGTVGITSSDPIATLPSSSSLTAGAKLFSVTLKTAGNQTITASDGTLNVTSSNILVNPSTATQLVLTSVPTTATACSPFNFTVTAKDAYNNVATGYGGTVAITSSDGAATLPSSSTLTSGTKSFSVTLSTAGTRTLTASDGTLNVTSSNITVDPNVAAQLILTSVPASATAGSQFSFTVTAKDACNNVATGYGGTVAITSSDGQATLPSSSTLTSGTKSFNITLKTAGNQTITASDGTLNVTSSNVLVNPSTATQLLLTSVPASATAGSQFSFTVTAKDAYNNVATGYSGMVAITSSDGAATLPSSSTLTSGTKSFNITLKTVGSQTITASDGTLNVTSSNITVDPAAASQLVLTSVPASSTAGAQFSFTVTAKDPYNNVATGYGGTVAITSSDGIATLPSSSTLTSGTKSFNITLKTAGTRTITASDGTLNVTSSNITVDPGAYDVTQSVVTSPASVNSGSSVTVTLTTKDAYGNTNPSGLPVLGNIAFTSSIVGGTGTYGSVSDAGSGVYTVSFTGGVAGLVTLGATISTVAVSNNATITVNPGGATQLVLTLVPASATAGNQFSFTVTAKDGSGNTATGYSGTVAITSTDGAATLPASSTLTSGVGSFNITLKTAGTQTVTANDGSLNVTSSNITVDPGATTQLVLSSIPGSATAGSQFAFSVTAKDAYNNTTPAYAGTVAITSSDGAAILPSSSTLTSGTKSFNITLKTAGNRTVTASDGSLNVTSSNIVVNPGTATQLLLSLVPASATSGSQFSFTVTAKDAYTNTVTAYPGTVAITSSDGAANLPSSSTLTSGTKSFDITLNTAGNQTVTANDGTLNVTSGNIMVNPGPIADLFFTGTAGAGQPDATRTAGVNFTSIQITAKDAAGNIATNASDSITIEPDDTNCTSGGVLGGTLTVALASGVATFTASNPQTAGTGYCLQAVTGGGIPNSVPSGTFAVTPGTQTQLLFAQQPTGTNISDPIDPAIVVAVADAYGNTVSSTKDITLAIVTNPGSSTLSGTLTQAAVAGVATFSNISLNNAGTGYVLSATCSSSPCLFTVNSQAFNVLNTTPINVQSAIELVDAGIQNGTSARNFTSTYVNLDPSYYDGTVTYTFEIVAKNANGSSRSVTLLSRAALASGSCTSSTSSTSTAATISVPGSTANLTRYTASITAPGSAKSYFIQLPAITLGGNQLQVSSARIIVTQTNARKTRIFVPMVAHTENTYGSASGSSIAADSTTSLTYTQGTPVKYYTWRKDVSQLINLAGSNALTLETVMSSSSNGQANYASLFNTTSSTQISTSTPTTAPTSTTPTFCTKSFNASDTGVTDNHDFEVKIKSGNNSSTAYLHKAGLWITLQGVTNLLTYNRIMRHSTVTGGTTFVGNRMKLSAGAFTSPTITYQCIATVSSSGVTAVMSSDSTNDSGTASVATVTNSNLVFSSASKTKLESSSLSITDNNRFLPTFTGSGNITYGSCMAIISVN